ncbi:hypothetical protein KAH37_04580 [bacterium]|nr:hypothetical protein [bacterium]
MKKIKLTALVLATIVLLVSCGQDTTNDTNDTDREGNDSPLTDDIETDDTDVSEGVDEQSDEVSDEVSDDDSVAIECNESDMYWIYDLSVMPPADKQICAHIRGEGENVHILVADDAWEESVNKTVIDNLITAWDKKTPNDENQGIFDQVTGLFGTPPDVFDNDPKIYLFLYEMAGYNGNSFDGYFKVEDVRDIAISNRHEMLHLNTVNKAPDSDYMLSVQSHEFQHLIHWNYDANEDAWLNEAMSEVAMVVTGFESDTAWVKSWCSDKRKSPLISSTNAYHYGILLLFGTYMYEQFGDTFIQNLVADEKNGIESVEDHLSKMDEPIDFRTLFAHFALAVAINTTDFEDGQYGYEKVDLPPLYMFPTDTVTASHVAGGGGTAYLENSGDWGNKTVTFKTDKFADIDYSITAMLNGTPTIIAQGKMTETPTDIPLGTQEIDANLFIVLSNVSTSDIEVEFFIK